jgi:sigma-E factor negative regulatory protein RseB
MSLNGSAREIIRDHDNVKCILPDSRSVLVDKRPLPAARFPSSIPNAANTEKLEGHYRFVDLGRGRIAGYECHVIGVRPRDGFRYGYRLWLDEKTAMLLRSDLVSERGQTVEQVMFTSLTMPKEIPAADLKPSVSGQGFVWHVQGEKAKPSAGENKLRWEVSRLPPGYHLSLEQVQHLAGAAHPVTHLIYTDGLASVSVFAEPLTPGKPVLRGSARMGAVNAFGRVLGKHHVTVVGEVPAATVRMIGESVHLRATGADDDH